jgi:hypothetical protein
MLQLMNAHTAAELVGNSLPVARSEFLRIPRHDRAQSVIIACVEAAPKFELVRTGQHD